MSGVSIPCAGNICWQQQGQLSVRRHQLGLTTTFRLTNILFTQQPLLSDRLWRAWEHLRELASFISRLTSITSHCSNHDEQGNHYHRYWSSRWIMFFTSYLWRKVIMQTERHVIQITNPKCMLSILNNSKSKRIKYDNPFSRNIVKTLKLLLRWALFLSMFQIKEII